jgi:cell shape-determining protein MreC
LRKEIDVRKTTLLCKEHITRRNKALEENLLFVINLFLFLFFNIINFIIPHIRNIYETTTESVASLFGSIHEIYSLLRRVIDDKDLDKANNEVNNAIREIQTFCKKIDNLKQQNGFPWHIPDNNHNTHNQGK